MKKQMMVLTAALITFPALSETNEHKQADGEKRIEHHTDDERDGRGRRVEHREMTEAEKDAMKERRVQMMEKALKDLGITKEQQQQITELQVQMKEQMRAAYMDIADKRKKLKELEGSGAPETEIFAAIDEVSEAQAEQMKILARSRIQMERILGKEKFEQFMDKARHKWKEHGRRGGQGMPPIPGQENKQKTPPAPPAIPQTP